MKWFRFYSEVLHDPKVQKLSGNDFKAWVNLLCLANESDPRGSIPPDADVAFALRIPVTKAAQITTRFMEWGLLDVDEDVHRLVIHKWNKWQPASDNAAERMANKRRTSSEQVLPREEEIRTEQNRTEREGEADVERAPSHPFALAFVKRYQERHAGSRPSPVQHAEAVALEDEHGADWCFRAADAFDWQKPPSYLRPWIIDHKEKASGNANGTDQRVAAAAQDTGGVAGGVPRLDRRSAAIAERRRRGL